MKVGFIGTRSLKEVSSDRYQAIKEALETYKDRTDITLTTGAAEGVDQWGAELALSYGMKVILYLPWRSFNRTWVTNLKNIYPSQVEVIVYDPFIHIEATQSVYNYHPLGKNIRKSLLCLHARNYLIVRECDLVLALSFTKGLEQGGTAQGIRLCKALGISVEEY